MPTDFLDELHRRANLASSEPRGWLITAANYGCTLSRENAAGSTTVARLAVRFQLNVLSPNVRVRLPFVRRQVDVVPDSADLDGEPIDLGWSAAGDELICDIFEPGAYELEFQLSPMLNDAAANALSCSIPKVAAATVDVWLPAEDVAVEIPDAAGERRMLDGGRRLSTRLGPVDTLKLRWPEQAAVAPVAEVEELLWLKVRPGSVVLDVMLKLNVTSGVLRQLEFAADRRLRLVPGAANATERAAPGQPDLSDAPQTTLLDLDQPLTGPASLRLSFFLSGASGVGSIRLPTFHTLHARPMRRWLAVTVDSGLEYETLGAEQLDALSAADFADEWGDADLALRDALAYRLNSAESAWSLATRSREPQTTVKETLSLSFQGAHAVVRYDAQLMTSAGFVFQHRLLVPPEIAIERIALEEEGVDRVSYWARGAPGVVSVFLNRRLTGAQQLTLTGRMPVRANGRVSVPLITMEPGLAPVTIEQAEVLSRTVYFYRQPTVRIALEDAEGLAPLPDAPPDSIRGRRGRLVFARTAERDYSGTIVVSPNDYKLRDVEQITS
ncbi:MAG: hypothetical protein ACREHD_02600, partial [Pirellulales bacterium]